MTLTDIETEGGYDWVAYYNSDSPVSYIVQHSNSAAGSVPIDNRLCFDNIMIRFYSDYAIPYRGFSISYSTIPG